MSQRLLDIEEMLAHLNRVCDDLSAVVARQGREIETLQRRVGMLLERAAEAEAEAAGLPPADQRPPHW